MSALSDQLLVVTVLGYLAAMIAHAAEYAFGTRSHVGRAAARPARELVAAGAPGHAGSGEAIIDTPVVKSSAPDDRDLVGRALADRALADRALAGRGSDGGGLDGGGLDGGGPDGGRAALAGRAAVVVTALAAAAHLGTLITRGVAAERMPWGNMYEFILTVTFIGVVAWLGTLLRWPAIRHLGLFVALVLVLLLGVAGMVTYTPVGPLVPALDSYWFVVHVASVALASGIFLLAFVPAAMYLIRSGYDRGKRAFPYTLGPRVPAAAALERLTFRLHAFAFPIWTFGALIAGPIWAEAAWGRYWGWDPKEIWAFISWVVYASYLHARATPSVRRSTATWIAVIGWLTMLMNLFGVNLFFEGLHSYAGVE